jgi:hypothetical protein
MGASLGMSDMTLAQCQLKQTFAFLNINALDTQKIMIPSEAGRFDSLGSPIEIFTGDWLRKFVAAADSEIIRRQAMTKQHAKAARCVRFKAINQKR